MNILYLAQYWPSLFEAYMYRGGPLDEAAQTSMSVELDGGRQADVCGRGVSWNSVPVK